MTYADRLNNDLRPVPGGSPLVLDLFAGAGGLSLGFEAAGFDVHGYEMNSDCCDTYRMNLLGPCHMVELRPDTEFPKADVVIGGPPCQPFSVAGLQAGEDDSRNGFPAFVSAVKQAQPRLFIAENVRGVFYRNREYVDTVCDELRSLGYTVDVQVINAVKYGVPQKRERVIIVGHDGTWRWPTPESVTVTAGDALGNMAYEAPEEAAYLTPNMDDYIARYEAKSGCATPRDLHLHIPSRTLTCRNLGGATSDMMRIRLPDGRRRRLRIEEASRLQSFPDWWRWSGNTTSVFNQIGNAVAPLLAMHLANASRAYLEGRSEGFQTHEQLRLI
jgi:DNA (cytosine-5)-methyltransferase 1